jgi:hypothetical protein
LGLRRKRKLHLPIQVISQEIQILLENAYTFQAEKMLMRQQKEQEMIEIQFFIMENMAHTIILLMQKEIQ